MTGVKLLKALAHLLTFQKHPLSGGQRRQRRPLRLLSHSWYQGTPDRIYGFQRPVVGVDL